MALAITVPRLGWTMEEGIFLGWLKQDGQAVKAGEPIFILESEKAAQEVEATESGILRISPAGPATGSTVLVGALLGYLAVEGEQVAFEKPAAASEQQAAKPNPSTAIEAPILLPPVVASATVSDLSRPEIASAALTISPRAARAAAALEVDWTRIRGTGRTGRIRERDVLAAVSARGARAPQIQSAVTEPPLPGRMLPLSSTRRTIARRMSAGVHEAAPVTLTARADATNLLAVRAQLKSAASSGQPVPTLNDFFVKLVAAALQQHPALNAQWRGDAVFFPDGINISIAVDTDDGLIAPVIHDVPAMTVHQVAAASVALIERARSGRLSREQVQGGTFTVTNLGGFGVEAFTPIINLPQCAILGIGRIAREPVLIDGQIVVRNVVPLSLSFDHRVVDGAPAARFLATLVRMVGAASASGPLAPVHRGEG